MQLARVAAGADRGVVQLHREAWPITAYYWLYTRYAPRVLHFSAFHYLNTLSSLIAVTCSLALAGYSTSLCTGTVKNIVSLYTHNGSPIFGWFLDATKAFDLVDHCILLQKLWTVVSPLLFSIFCCPGIVRRSVVFVGALVVPTPLVFQMAFVKVVSSCLYFLHYTWMVCWLILLSVALVVIGIIYLLVVCVMLMTLFCLHPALLH